MTRSYLIKLPVISAVVELRKVISKHFASYNRLKGDNLSIEFARLLHLLTKFRSLELFFDSHSKSLDNHVTLSLNCRVISNASDLQLLAQPLRALVDDCKSAPPPIAHRKLHLAPSKGVFEAKYVLKWLESVQVNHLD